MCEAVERYTECRNRRRRHPLESAPSPEVCGHLFRVGQALSVAGSQSRPALARSVEDEVVHRQLARLFAHAQLESLGEQRPHIREKSILRELAGDLRNDLEPIVPGPRRRVDNLGLDELPWRSVGDGNEVANCDDGVKPAGRIDGPDPVNPSPASSLS
jgi:hypothetical protein